MTLAIVVGVIVALVVLSLVMPWLQLRAAVALVLCGTITHIATLHFQAGARLVIKRALAQQSISNDYVAGVHAMAEALDADRLLTVTCAIGLCAIALRCCRR